MDSLLSVAAVVAAIYAALCAALYFSQHRMIYAPSRELASTPADAGLSYEDLTLHTADGTRIHAWLVAPIDRPAPRRTVLFAHGNGGNIGDRQETLLLLARLGMQVMILDYRGYGRSGGAPSEHGTYLDIEAAWLFLVDTRSIAPTDIAIFGRSLGGGPAAWLAERVDAAALVLESTFTSIPDVAAKRYPLVPVRLLARVRYATLERMTRIDMPVLVIHSPEDQTIPYQHGRQLFEAALEPKWFLEISGHHADGFITSGAAYADALEQFLVSLPES